MLYRGAETNGFLGLLRLIGIPHVRVASTYRTGFAQCSGPAEHVAFPTAIRLEKMSDSFVYEYMCACSKLQYE
jgi:hypothetical protein